MVHIQVEAKPVWLHIKTFIVLSGEIVFQEIPMLDIDFVQGLNVVPTMSLTFTLDSNI